jgi:hypothetical protein
MGFLFSSPPLPDRLWNSLSLLSSRYRDVKMTTHLHLVPRLRMRGDIPPFPQYVFMAWFLVNHMLSFNGEMG